MRVLLVLPPVLVLGACDAASGSDSASESQPAPVANVRWSLDDDIGSLGIVSWEQTEAVSAAWVEFRVGEAPWQASPAAPAEAGALSAWVAGVPYGATVEARVVNTVDDAAATTDSVFGDTLALPEGVTVPELAAPLADAVDPAIRFIAIGLKETSEAYWKLIFNRDGEVVWAHPSNGDTGTMVVSAEGTHLVWDEDTFNVFRMTLDGTLTETVELPGLHHSMVEVGEGTLIWGGRDGDRDHVWERSASGAIRGVFDCASYWEDHGATSPCDTNGVTWRKSDDTLLVSSDNAQTVAHVKRQTGEVLAAFGQLDGAWSFDPPESRFYKQHSPLWTEEGNLLVSDWATGDDHTLTAREYSLDEEARRLTLVWVCDTESGIPAEHAGETRRLPGGNTLLNYGPGAAVREYTAACEQAWGLTWPEGTSLRRMTELDGLYGLLPEPPPR